ncbi:multidrug efflux RND transporter permease subunit [Gilvimarinus sp. SDUM040013]|uniref:Efflux pump membrane transporter n=1 Tax=Gilvimarinus gilvus TaxID=3058038 RepID=A0ABU4RS90_9GAMM|nr:multidrug efflux RND transporter permease subunit [Gilvimarinus sp. SDUM040013]MDO3388200.1 multidrug efflux RND transporter permease subunit [Gilvimarinus sp. SDUM040013]MDX6847750.1 multidrug efflux RND transporter permease subunit [Gilvimarinus sp. SDUM040013]
MISKTFIYRPKFAFVISIVITLVGLLALSALPINMYPQLTPPKVNVSAVYPGASAQVVEEALLRPLEEQINGVEDMLYIESSASNNGSAAITVTFATGTDVDMAQVNVQNRVALAEPFLPEEAKRQGITVRKQSTDMLMGINVVAREGSKHIDNIFLSNYATNNFVEPLARVPGVAKVEVMGGMSYAMRLWLNPERMSVLNITVADVSAALREQNVIVAAGKLGQAPVPDSQQFEYSIQAQGRLIEAKEFGNIILRADADGAQVRMRDIARVELGSQNYGGKARLNNSPTAFLVVYQLPDANAIAVAKNVRAVVADISATMPDSLKHFILYDSTRFIERSIKEVVITLVQAVVLVILVVFAFLQNWRATIVPSIAIPVSLIGTFACMLALGYSINTITLFGLVLAIGVVVDDAIIVIENTERILHEEKCSVREATLKTMQQVTGPVIATTLVLLAVFVPVGFMPGITGELYKQFSVTISCAVIISSINALTLSPALCAVLLRPDSKPVIWMAPFERMLSKLTRGYQATVGGILKRAGRMGLAAALLFVGLAVMAIKLPTGFVPQEDQGYLFLDVQLPDAASSVRTDNLMDKVSEIVLAQPGVTDVISVSGFSLQSGSGSNNGFGIVVLDDWDARTTAEVSLRSIIAQLQAKLWQVPEARVMVFNLPAIPGLGTSSGFEFQLQDNRGRTPAELAQALNGLVYSANSDADLDRVYSTYRANVPQYFLDVDRAKAKAQGVAISEIFATLQTHLGSLYVNDFSQFSRTYRVILQADSQYRLAPEDLQYYFVRNSAGQMVPILTLVSIKPILGPTTINHFNLYRSAKISGEATTGLSSGQAIKAMSQVAEQLPEGFTYEWSGQSKQEIDAGNLAPLLFGLALLFVYLFLVAQYESWTIPLAVLSAVPLSLLGAFGILLLAGLENNVYAQIGMVLLIGLSSKTAILIVEFAMEQRRAGKSIFDAAFIAAHLRFRAVLMTALSFVLGVLPLVFSTGAGAASRVSLGMTVFGGMLAASILGTLLLPLFYWFVQHWRERIGGAAKSGQMAIQ